MNAKFQMGGLVGTPNALERIPSAEILIALQRHLAGDWGDVDEQDREENEFSLTRDLRLFSVYHAKSGVKFWIISEADRSVTTVLLPCDY